ncbi:hypothetical protein F2Q69_00026771 [Brassica cretica]|uniref:Uncharacterized protein n=1 Tax=Brassica cretica TaxID=69181 RepID=A0A8S9SC01_BRACR|nr:hypothetical protein F2Q69_00026771 [Brassica cretica]
MRDSISAASILRRWDSSVPKPPSFSSNHQRICDNLAVTTTEPFNSTSAPTFVCADGSPSTADYNSEINRFDQTRDLAGPSS